MKQYSRPGKTGFTLVELLVVIGIIALLISVLLPALGKARKSANNLKCLSNIRGIGQAMMQYSVTNNGVIVPTVVWSSATVSDPWPFFLIAGKYLPNPNIMAGDSAAATNTILVCPTVRDAMAIEEPNGTILTTVATTDGFERRFSKVLLPNTLTPTPNPVNNGTLSKGAAIVDIGYGVNGATDSTQGLNAKFSPMQAVSIGTAKGVHPTRKYSQYRKASQTILLFDGSAWNVGTTGTNSLWRIAGSRHGNWVGKDATTQYSTGTTNVLFLDGHAEGVNRADLPTYKADGVQIFGDKTQVKNNKYYWNSAQY